MSGSGSASLAYFEPFRAAPSLPAGKSSTVRRLNPGSPSSHRQLDTGFSAALHVRPTIEPTNSGATQPQSSSCRVDRSSFSDFNASNGVLITARAISCGLTVSATGVGAGPRGTTKRHGDRPVTDPPSPARATVGTRTPCCGRIPSSQSAAAQAEQ